jgi:hypothetical protein
MRAGGWGDHYSINNDEHRDLIRSGSWNELIEDDRWLLATIAASWRREP